MTQFLDLTQLTAETRTEATHPITGKVVMIVYRKGGVVHRDDGPAAIHVDENGNHWAQEWYQNGKIHRADGPARMYVKHPMPMGEAAIAAKGERIAEWHFNGEYQGSFVLDHDTFYKHFHKGT